MWRETGGSRSSAVQHAAGIVRHVHDLAARAQQDLRHLARRAPGVGRRAALPDGQVDRARAKLEDHDRRVRATPEPVQGEAGLRSGDTARIARKLPVLQPDTRRVQSPVPLASHGT